MPDATDLRFELLPADDEFVSDVAALDAAAAGAIEATGGPPVLADAAPAPYGRSWEFDFDEGRFRRTGGSPAEVRGQDTLKQWCLMAVHSARFAHAVFSDEFGMEDPEEVIGEVVVEEMVPDFERHLTEALLVHDRVASIENFDAEYDPAEGILYITSLDVVTDEEDGAPLSLAGLRIRRED